jgi:hypothetical protein
VAVVGDAIQNGVGIGWVTDHDVPFVDRQQPTLGAKQRLNPEPSPDQPMAC